MSLDVYLYRDVSRFPVAADWLQDGGFDAEAAYLRAQKPEHFYSANVTHNLNRMAEAAGVHQHLWCPEEIGVSRAGELVGPLRAGLAKLLAEPEAFRRYDAANGWGRYEDFVEFVREYLRACETYPDALVEASR